MTATVAAPPQQNWLLLVLRLRTFVALILVLAYFSVMAPNFLSAAKAVIVSKHVALNSFLAIGMTFVIISGGIDLSVGSSVGLCAMVAGWLILNGVDLGVGYAIWFNTVEIVGITLAVGVGVGLINGLLITRLNVAPFIATLGTLYIARGAALLSSDGRTFPNLSGTDEMGTSSFPLIGSGTLLGLPVMIWLLVVVALAAHYVSRRTPLGRHIYAVGGNERGAAVLGGTSMSGGRGRIFGTIIRAFVIGILSDGLIMMGVSSFWQTMIKGVVIDQAQSRLRARVALAQEAAASR